jgi:plasmid maintenance system antidote protein VapI
MTSEQRTRAGNAVAARLIELGMTPGSLARLAGVDVTTIRALIRGTRWPRMVTAERINSALGWAPGELQRIGLGSPIGNLSNFRTVDLAREVYARLSGGA